MRHNFRVCGELNRKSKFLTNAVFLQFGDLPFRNTRTISNKCCTTIRTDVKPDGSQAADSYLYHPLYLEGCPAGNPETLLGMLVDLLLFGQVFFISAYPADMKMNAATLPGINHTIDSSFGTQ
jgi:hypothetical protein